MLKIYGCPSRDRASWRLVMKGTSLRSGGVSNSSTEFPSSTTSTSFFSSISRGSFSTSFASEDD